MTRRGEITRQVIAAIIITVALVTAAVLHINLSAPT
jgi:hypothetical protein